MLITRRSPLTGKLNSLELPITAAQITRWHSGDLIQRAFPHLSTDEREFLITGLYPGEFDDFLGLEPE